MKVLLQRVSQAAVRVEGREHGAIGAGLLLLVGFGRGDSEDVLGGMVRRVVNCRVFADEEGRFQYSVLESGGGILAVPQFTLYGNAGRGRRPDFGEALAPQYARPLFDQFLEVLAASGVSCVQSGVFGARMEVSLVNDGPVTLMLVS